MQTFSKELNTIFGNIRSVNLSILPQNSSQVMKCKSLGMNLCSKASVFVSEFEFIVKVRSFESFTLPTTLHDDNFINGKETNGCKNIC